MSQIKQVRVKALKKTISDSVITSISNQTYTGLYIKPTIKVKYGSKILKSGIDYTVTYSNNKNIGLATAIITGKGDYTGTKKITYNIIPKKVTGLKISKQTADSIKLSWSKVDNSTGYKVYRYNKIKKSYECIKTISDNKILSYTNSSLKSGSAYNYIIKSYKIVGKTTYYSIESSTIKTYTKPSRPSILSISSKSAKKVTLKWNCIKESNGYEIYRSTSKNGKYSKIKTITSASTVSYINDKLTSNKTYFYKIISCKTIDGKKLYSSYSPIKSIKVK